MYVEAHIEKMDRCTYEYGRKDYDSVAEYEEGESQGKYFWQFYLGNDDVCTGVVQSR